VKARPLLPHVDPLEVHSPPPETPMAIHERPTFFLDLSIERALTTALSRACYGGVKQNTTRCRRANRGSSPLSGQVVEVTSHLDQAAINAAKASGRGQFCCEFINP